MDQYLSTIIVALITGIFSIITMIIQSKQDKVISKINEQTTFLEREKDLKKQVMEKEKERERIIHQVLMLVLETNLQILNNTQIPSSNTPSDEEFQRSAELKKRFNELNEAIRELNKEYHIVADMTEEFREELNKMTKK